MSKKEQIKELEKELMNTKSYFTIEEAIEWTDKRNKLE